MNNRIAKRGIVSLLLMMISVAVARGQSPSPAGTIKGTVLKRESREPVAGASVRLLRTTLGAIANARGEFSIANVPAGNYSLEITGVAIRPYSISDIVVRPGRTTPVSADVEEMVIEGKGVSVMPGYFTHPSERFIGFNAEEIRRSPAAAGDVSRTLGILPSVARVNDRSNGLAVRGGSPFENAFFIDDIRVPSTDHFPEEGSSGGGISMLNTNLIQDVQFLTGGFGASYGDRLSSVVNIGYREGSREKLEGQLDLNMGGAGGAIEGPLPWGNGSFVASARRSFLDLLVGAIGTGVAPVFGDAQGKAAWDINDHHRVELLDLFGQSEYHYTRQDALEDGSRNYDDQLTRQNTVGVHWRAIWSPQSSSSTSISYSFNHSSSSSIRTANDETVFSNGYREGTIGIRNVNLFSLGAIGRLEFGAEAYLMRDALDYFFASYLSRDGVQVPELRQSQAINSNTLGAFATWTIDPLEHLSIGLGVRGDHYTLNGASYLNPRISISYALSDQFTLNGSGGIFTQELPLFLISQNNSNRDLHDPQATHIVFGIDYIPRPDLKISLEGYSKDYTHLPLVPSQPRAFVLDDAMEGFTSYGALLDGGLAYSRGVELLAQKKLADDYYGTLSATYFRSRYRDGLGEWHDRMYDNRIIISMMAGYKPAADWELSFEWTFAGGRPYTPFDVAASTAAGTGQYDTARTMGERLPAYQALNLRVDKHFFFSSSSIIVYLNLLNAYDYQNVFRYLWSNDEARVKPVYQFSILPIVGVEWDL